MAISSSGISWDRSVTAGARRRLHPLLVVRVLLDIRTVGLFNIGTFTSFVAWLDVPVWVFAWPVLMLLLAGWSSLHDARNLRLLRSGRLASAQLLRVDQDQETPQPARGGGSDIPHFSCHFSFRAEDGREHQLQVKTLDPKQLTDNLVDAVLYDPEDPGRAVWLASLPGEPRLTDDGTFTVKDPQSMPYFLLPFVAFVALNTVGWRWILGGD